jgi:diacylglycerol kinase (ATP)
MDQQPTQPWRSRGLRRLFRAIGHQWSGIRHGLREDAAIRQVSAAWLVLTIVALCLPVSRIERLLLLVAPLLVVMAEYLNSAIETVVDRISLDPHPLAGRAKDLASVAVALAALICLLCWAMIAGPLLVLALA